MANPTPFTVSLGYVTQSLSLSVFPVVSTLVAPILLVWLAQGREVLDMVSDEQIASFWKHPTTLLHYALFILALQCWAFANWYGSRVLLQFDFRNPLPSGSFGNRVIAAWNEWLPRLLGILGPALIAGYILFVRRQWRAGGIAAIVVVLFAFFIINRRRIFKLKSVRHSMRSELLKGDRIAIWLGFSCSISIFITMSTVNYSFARTLGAPVILFTALASIVLTGSVLLAYLPLSFGWPNFAWMPALVAFILGGTQLTHNHSVTARVIKSADRGCDPRPSVVDDFLKWKEMAVHKDPKFPIFLVAAEGGASRSAWWTAHVLTALDYASDGEFSHHVYAVSGVSGGSLGAATYVGILAERDQDKPRFSEPLKFPELAQCWNMREDSGPAKRINRHDNYPTPMQAECFLGEDFLSTTLGYMLYPDLVQRFFPVPVHSWDRSLGLEQTWQNDWSNIFGARKISEKPPIAVSKFGDPLDTLYHPDGNQKNERKDIPLLFLNSTRSQAGRSALQSPVAIPSAELDDVFDGQLHTRGLPLSAVVHNSARFPLVSPGGEVETWNGDHWDTLVDGGYFENSGAATLAELIRALRAANALTEEDLGRIHVIFIMNDPQADLPIFRAPAKPDALIETLPPISQEELLTPLLGLYNTRSARADSSKRSLMALLPHQEEKATEIFLSRGLSAVRKLKGHENDPDPAMSWYMNPSSRRNMWSALAEPRTYADMCKVLRSVGTTSCARLEQFRYIPAEGDR